jgi:NAD-dependent SIR2 family protein deacetylase
MTGAGISVSCGIPDFRSPKTGIYANLKEYDLPTPESLFTLEYFIKRPEAFYKFAQQLNLDSY